MKKHADSIGAAILDRIQTWPQDRVWTPLDFLDLGSRAAADNTLSRNCKTGAIRRAGRGLYHIDFIVDKEVLGFGGDSAPDKAPSNKQRKARLEGLMDACRDWVQGTPQSTLASRIQSALGETSWQLEVGPDMPDGQCLLFHYPTVFPPSAAADVRPVVKIELGARSDDWPHEEKSIQPYLNPNILHFLPR